VFLVVIVSFQRLRRQSFASAWLIAIVLMLAAVAAGQSSDQDLPTPVRTNDLNGTIPALDLGDPRQTRHFYAFSVMRGDLLITVESRNLTGDVDIFTAANFKPLVKIPMYSQASSSMTTRSIFLRGEDVLILRVEARSPNDDIGVYRIRFGGAFAPFSGDIPVAENEETAEPDKAATAPRRRGTRRVSSVGARVEEPAITIAPETTPPSEEKKAESVKPAEESASRESGSTKSRTTARASSRTRPSTRNTKAKPSKSAKAGTDKKPAGDEAPSAKPEPSSEGEIKPTVAATATEVEKRAAETTPKQETIAQPQAGGRLIIVEADGTKIDRPMSTIRRVIVDNGWIVVFLKNGKIERISMSDVARMTIEP
jgi:hypothetical protein